MSNRLSINLDSVYLRDLLLQNVVDGSMSGDGQHPLELLRVHVDHHRVHVAVRVHHPAHTARGEFTLQLFLHPFEELGRAASVTVASEETDWSSESRIGEGSCEAEHL